VNLRKDHYRIRSDLSEQFEKTSGFIASGLWLVCLRL